MSQATRGSPIRILMIGPEPPPVGGTTVLFRSLVEALGDRPGITVTVVNTVGVRGSGAAGPLRLLRLAWSVFRGMRGADVAALHVSTTGLHLLGPLAVCAARRSRIPLIIRKFGGSDFLEYGPVRRACALWALRRADLYLAETLDLVERGRATGLSAEWLPNSRAMPKLTGTGARDCRRFVFLGQIHSGKGVRELLAAGERLPSGLSVDVYGILGFDIAEDEFAGLERVYYRGAVRPGDVHGVLVAHDALVLPSYYGGEGYPGVILEAYAAGLPVVSTRWRAIPELVDEGVTGLLVDPRDAGALHDAMLSLVEDKGLYARLREGVRRIREQFSDEVWQEKFLEYCRSLTRS